MVYHAAVDEVRRDELIESVARRLEGAGLAAPAVALLEANKPFSFLGSQALLFAEPFLGLLITGTRDWVALLEDRGNVELLISRLETGAVGPAPGAPALPPEDGQHGL